MFTIKIDFRTALIEATCSGVWQLGDVPAFARAVTAAAEPLTARNKGYVLLCDFTGMAFQPREVVAALLGMASKTRARAQKAALFTTGVRGRLQAKRIAACTSDIAVFDDRAKALAWLLDDSQPTRPADHHYAPACPPELAPRSPASLPGPTPGYMPSRLVRQDAR